MFSTFPKIKSYTSLRTFLPVKKKKLDGLVDTPSPVAPE